MTAGSSAPAIKDAAHNAREALEGLLEDVLGAEVGEYVWKGGRCTPRATPIARWPGRRSAPYSVSRSRSPGSSSSPPGSALLELVAKVEVDTDGSREGPEDGGDPGPGLR